MKVLAENSPAVGQRMAIIGTGPVSLLKACLLAKANPSDSITLIDSASQIGGAWYSDLSPKGHEIECGCHIWSYTPAVYRYIEQELGIHLIPMKPNAVFIGKNLRVPYSIKNSVDSYKRLIKTTIGLKWGQFSAMQSAPNVNFKIIGKKNKYPQTGSPELIHALEKKLSMFPNVQILLNSEIEEIKIDSIVQLITGEKKLEFDKIFMTYVSRIKLLSVDGIPLNLKIRKVNYIHFLIQPDRPLNKKISYWRLMNDPVIHRITDISYQTNHEENLILVGIKDVAYDKQSEPDLLKHVRETLLNYKLIDESHKLEKLKTHFFPTHYLKSEALDQLLKLKNKMELMHTTDLMYGIHHLLREEKII